MAAKASVDMAMVEGQGDLRQRSTTFTSTVAPPLQGFLWPLRHLSLYRLPQAAPLSHNPSLTATNRFPGGNWSCWFPKHPVAAQKLHFIMYMAQRREHKRLTRQYMLSNYESQGIKMLFKCIADGQHNISDKLVRDCSLFTYVLEGKKNLCFSSYGTYFMYSRI